VQVVGQPTALSCWVAAGAACCCHHLLALLALLLLLLLLLALPVLLKGPEARCCTWPGAHRHDARLACLPLGRERGRTPAT
jgi:hypothetical protein